MSFETSVGTSDADSITVMGRDLARELMGKVTLTELAFLRRAAAHAHAGGDAPVRRGARLARRPRAHAHRPRRAAHPYRARPNPYRGRSRPGCWGPEASSWVSWRTRCASSTRRATTWTARWRASWRRAGASPGSDTRSTRCEDPRTPRIYAIAEETGLTGPYLARLSELAAAHARQTGRGAADQRRRRGRRRAGRPRASRPAAARIRAAGADRGVARSPRGRDAEPYRDAPLPRGG